MGLKPTQRKELSISQLKSKADKVFSDFIRQRDEGKCITCGKTDDWKYLQAGHYIPRDCIELRYDERNVNCQCYGCNVCKKGNYPIYSLKMIEKNGSNVLYELEEIVKKYKADGLRKYPKDFYIEIIERFRENKE